MNVRKSLQDLLSQLKLSDEYQENIVHWETLEAKTAKTIDFPDSIHPSLKEALQKRGIHALYTHQREAYESVMMRKNIVAVTPTASGKTLCYNLPVLETIIENPNARALYIFPTKALAQDQKSEINELIQEAGLNINSYTYDGDTPANIRQKGRKARHIVINNHDMLHSAILPHHTKWVSLFENLKYIIIDELHISRGLFLRHVGNV